MGRSRSSVPRCPACASRTCGRNQTANAARRESAGPLAQVGGAGSAGFGYSKTQVAQESIILGGSFEGWQMLTDFRRDMKEAVLTLVLSANLPTGASQGGSYALAGIQ